MKLCIKHWKKLQDRIEEIGLSHLISNSIDELIEKMRSLETDSPTEKNYDPLIDSHNMIVAAIINLAGQQVINQDICPICEAMKQLCGEYPDGTILSEEDIEKEFIEGPVHAAFNFCVKEKIIILQ